MYIVHCSTLCIRIITDVAFNVHFMFYTNTPYALVCVGRFCSHYDDYFHRIDVYHIQYNQIESNRQNDEAKKSLKPNQNADRAYSFVRAWFELHLAAVGMSSVTAICWEKFRCGCDKLNCWELYPLKTWGPDIILNSYQFCIDAWRPVWNDLLSEIKISQTQIYRYVCSKCVQELNTCQNQFQNPFLMYSMHLHLFVLLKPNFFHRGH